MSFLLSNFVRQTVGLNSGEVTVNSSPVGGPAIFSYANLGDTLATISAANYFASSSGNSYTGVEFDVSPNDLIYVQGSDTDGWLTVVSVTTNPPAITTQSAGFSSQVGTSNIVNNAVTYAKFQQVAADSLVGNPTGSLANAEGITLGNGLAFSGTTLIVPLNIIQYTSVSLTLADITGMYATPVQILAAPGAGLMNIIDSWVFNFVYGSAQLVNAGGGNVGLQYGNTDHLGGVQASGTEATADWAAATANTMFRVGGGLGTGAVTSSCINTAIYISCSGAAFSVGTGGSGTLDVWYKTVSAS